MLSCVKFKDLDVIHNIFSHIPEFKHSIVIGERCICGIKAIGCHQKTFHSKLLSDFPSNNLITKLSFPCEHIFNWLVSIIARYSLYDTFLSPTPQHFHGFCCDYSFSLEDIEILQLQSFECRYKKWLERFVLSRLYNSNEQLV